MKQIKGYPDYFVTETGQVWSNKGKCLRLMKLNVNRDGYQCVTFCVNYIRTTKKVHRLVAEAFIPNLDNKPQVNHISEIKTDNHIDNLEWCTAKENCNHGTGRKRWLISLRKNSKGVSWFKRDKKWRAYCTIGGSFVHLGYFNMEQDALDARQKFVEGL